MRQRNQRLAEYRPGVSVKVRNAVHRRDEEPPRKQLARFAALLRLCALMVLSISSACAEALLYIGAWPKQIIVIDESQQKVIDRIRLQTGTPRHVEISDDRKKLFVSTWEKNGVEVVDLEARKVVNSFLLDEGNRKVRFRGFACDPQNRFLYTVIKVAVKDIDRFTVDPQRIAVIDLAQQKIVKTADYPKDEDPTFVIYQGGLRLSPDGKHLYEFGRNVLIFDTTELRLQDKIELAKPRFPGMERVGLDAGNDPMDEPGFMTSLFIASDPVVHRRVFGLARVDLTRASFDFTPVGPVAQDMPEPWEGALPLRLTPDRKTGYTVALRASTPGNRRSEFWVFDMDSRRLVRTVEFAARTRFDFTISSTGKQLYIYTAGPTIDIYDAGTLQLQKVINLDADVTTGLLVVPVKKT